MHFFRQVLSFIGSRRMPAIAAVAVLALLVGFAGPFVAVDGARPLAPVGARVALIVTLVAIGVLWYFDGPTSLAGPDHSGVHDEAARPGPETASDNMRRAIAQLRGLSTQSALRRMFQGRRRLYKLPWYIVIGGPGAGKTSAILNAGLRLPDTRRIAEAREESVKSDAAATVKEDAAAAPTARTSRPAGGTPHCEWWLADKAVFIDTAGRYTTQDGDPIGDPAEWRGLLALLRKHRPRAPVHGALAVLDAAALITMPDGERAVYAERVRHRLAELREELGIRFPVYVVVTRMDLLRGFTDYFQSLTSEGRAQVWGFTRVGEEAGGDTDAGTVRSSDALQASIAAELALLQNRLEDGLRARLDEEPGIDRRRCLFALPREFAAMAARLAEVLAGIFGDSRADDSARDRPMLRSVYFTSAAPATIDIPADLATLVQRLRHSLRLFVPRDADLRSAPPRAARIDTAPTHGRQGFFLQDLLADVIVPEAHLVRADRRREFRFRIAVLFGYATAIAVFAWLAGALTVSFGNNRDYLEAVAQRVETLAGRAGRLVADARPDDVPDASETSDVLAAARELPTYRGLDPANASDPPPGFAYGLYSVPPVVEAARRSHAQLRTRTLLVPILQRMEAVMAQSLRDSDASAAYRTLRVYQLLHDATRYAQPGGARDVREWVVAQRQYAQSDAASSGRGAIHGHVDALFAGDHPVQATSRPDDALVREVRQFLAGKTLEQRIYERARTAMLPDAPPDFTLLRAVGPRAATVFARNGGASLDKGVPGLFTYDGYHALFAPRLAVFARNALEDDAWVMGRKSAVDETDGRSLVEAVIDDVRGQYLTEYAWHWETFLDSIRTVGSGSGSGSGGVSTALPHFMPADAAGAGLGSDLGVLRQFAAPDSPLARLARAAARETTLVPVPVAERLPDRAADALGDPRRVRQLVDDRFAALREVIAGVPAAPTSAARSGLESISGLVNEFYVLLTMADTALAAGTLPPGGTEIGARLRLEAGKLPAPFREVLLELAARGSGKVMQRSSSILRRRAQAQLDRLNGLLATQVGEPCRRGIDGRYPMAPSAQDVSIDDFTLVFAAGGAFDEFFLKQLAPFVDTGVRPWRYRDPDGEAGELLKLLARNGPSLDAFQRARQIREAFFGDAGGCKFGWKLDLKVIELEPSITDLVIDIDIDGQGLRYVHGPVRPFTVAWPGLRGGSVAGLTSNPRVSGPTSALMTSGPWALLRLVDRGRIVSTALPGRRSVEYVFDGRKALLEVNAGSRASPLGSELLRGFRCPGRAT